MRLGAFLMPRVDFQRQLDALITDITPLPWPKAPIRWNDATP
jgi:leucyl/phenylalanyl-tRNA--protein transferase